MLVKKVIETDQMFTGLQDAFLFKETLKIFMSENGEKESLKVV